MRFLEEIFVRQLIHGQRQLIPNLALEFIPVKVVNGNCNVDFGQEEKHADSANHEAQNYRNRTDEEGQKQEKTVHRHVRDEKCF
jgi:hypothetical protein